MNRTVIIAADGTINQQTLGDFKYLKIRAASTAFQLSWDGSEWRDAALNDEFDAPDGQQRIYFRVTTGIASTVTFTYQVLPFKSQDTAQSQAKTYLFGNGGIANGAAAAGGNPSCNASGYLQIANALNWRLPGTNNGHRRQSLIITVKGAGSDLNIALADGTTFCNIINGSQTVTIITDADLYLSGAGGNSSVTVGEIYLQNS